MQIVFGIFYVLVGFLLAIPYCLLAGWSYENFPMVAFVAPAFLFIWLMLGVFSGVITIRDHHRPIHFDWRVAFRKGGRSKLPGSLLFFWAWTLYSLLPIILHWSYVLLEEVGYETVASLINTHRYTSTLYVFVATFAFIALMGMLTSALGVLSNTWRRFVRR